LNFDALQVELSETEKNKDLEKQATDNINTASPSVPQGPKRLPQLWPALAEQHGDALALLDPHASPPTQYSFRELASTIELFAFGLDSLGLSHRDTVALFAENSAHWLVADQAIMACGAADAVRGVSSPFEELRHIMQHSQCSGLVVGDAATLEKVLPAFDADAPGSNVLRAQVRFVVLLWGDIPSSAVDRVLAMPCPVLTFDQVLARGDAEKKKDPPELSGKKNSGTVSLCPEASCDDLATLVYTSGTTGKPKGVMLTHQNILYQVSNLETFLRVVPGERTLSLLPPWHIYERTASYHVLSRGATQVYTSIRRFKEDLTAFPPDHLVCVPLVLDTLRTRVLATLKKASTVRRIMAGWLLAAALAYARAKRVVQGLDIRFAVTRRPVIELFKAFVLAAFLAPFNALSQRLVGAKVRAALGVKGCIISGGGSLAAHLDDFFEAIGVPVLNGWGLTETSPVLACRSVRRVDGNIRGTVGRVIPGTELRVVNPLNTDEEVADGRQGVILARGPGVSPGYWRDETATAAAFIGDKEGLIWFNTGDLGWRAPCGVASSRMAGCVVLTGRSKDTIVLSSGENVEPQPIEDAICCSPLIKCAVLIGQAHRSLGALIVPDSDALAEAAEVEKREKLSSAQLRAAVRAAIDSACEGRVRWERVSAFTVLKEPFSVEDGTLTRTMKPRRGMIAEKYAKEIAELETRLR